MGPESTSLTRQAPKRIPAPASATRHPRRRQGRLHARVRHVASAHRPPGRQQSPRWSSLMARSTSAGSQQSDRLLTSAPNKVLVLQSPSLVLGRSGLRMPGANVQMSTPYEASWSLGARRPEIPLGSRPRGGSSCRRLWKFLCSNGGARTRPRVGQRIRATTTQSAVQARQAST